ncbi:hypothetical protein GDO86_018641 [Hymenochirus boettgeri]|uniref:Uncharacterized protein n=1 Tax=Hymenochirus boettgeri TaxID=247094 RepID=A0A8T2IGY0_9PIPI|nr:hypothetical protein GDO86_018641 [Hymenochirus boettgeri]
MAAHKHYHDEEYDPCCAFETYIGSKRLFKDNALEDAMTNVYKMLSSGSVKGDNVIDVSLGLFLFPLLIAVDYFKNIVKIESSDCSIEEIQKWIEKEPSSIDKSHMAAFACALKGKSTGWKEQEYKLRNAIKQIVKWDISQENPLGSVTLPQADCLTSVLYLECVCKDHNRFCQLMKQFSSLLKTGGHLILVTCINTTYYTVGQHRFSALKIDEKFVHNILKDSGFIIKSFDTFPKQFDSDLTDYEYIECNISIKQREI